MRQSDLSKEEIDEGLQLFNAGAVVVGHTVQRKVKKMYDGKVFSLDVNHPKDYKKTWPAKHSEGLLIDNGIYYRLLHDGEKVRL